MIVGANMLTVYPDSLLYEEIQNGNWKEESETEKYCEMRTLAEHLDIPTVFAAMGASNVFQLWYSLPDDKEQLLGFLDEVIWTSSGEKLRAMGINRLSIGTCLYDRAGWKRKRTPQCTKQRSAF